MWTWDLGAKSLEVLRADSFDELMTRFLNRYTVWLKWHWAISRSDKELTVDEVYDDEKNAGIDYLKALASDK